MEELITQCVCQQWLKAYVLSKYPVPDSHTEHATMCFAR